MTMRSVRTQGSCTELTKSKNTLKEVVDRQKINKHDELIGWYTENNLEHVAARSMDRSDLVCDHYKHEIIFLRNLILPS